MGVDPFLIAPTLVLSLAQRLVRKCCDDAKESVPVDGSIKAIIDQTFSDLPEEHKRTIAIPDVVYRATSSALCPSGTRGRTAVFEMLEMDRTIEKLIVEGEIDTKIAEYMRSLGTRTMKMDALDKAFQGIIPFDEVNTLV